MKTENGTYKYYVFISYSHTDIRTARVLKLLLETYKFPVAIQKVNPGLPKRMRVFRDRDELTSGELNEEIKKKLDESKYLVVICSPQSVASKYVGQEIKYFCSTGREKQIIPFIIKGAPHSDEECFHPELLKAGELLGINVQQEESPFCIIRFQKAFIRLVCKLMNIEFSVLWDRRKHFLIKLGILTLAVFSLLAVLGFQLFKAQPFDAKVKLEDKYASLPLSTTHTDSLYLYLDETDVRAEVVLKSDDNIEFRNIPGKFKGEKTKIKFSAYGFNATDTCILLDEQNVLKLSRDSSTYGHIRYQVSYSDTDQPAAGVQFGFGFMNILTDENGVLDVTIPLENQSLYYHVKITKGTKQYVLTYPCNGGDFLTAIQSENLQVIYKNE